MELDEKICMENIDQLTEEELRLLEVKWKNESVSPYRLWLLLPYNIIFGGMTMYYTINFKQQLNIYNIILNESYSSKLFKPQSFGFKSIVKYGTIQSLTFVVLYVGGTFLISGLWHPVLYLRGLAQIKGKQIDTALRFDPYAQKHFLFDMMGYFGLSDDLIHKAKNELVEQKDDLDRKNYFAPDTLKLLNEPLDILQKKQNDL